MRNWVLLVGLGACIGSDPNVDESSSLIQKDKGAKDSKKCKPHKKHQDCGTATVAVSVDGGQVATESGLTLDIPYGALDSSTTITVTTTDQTQPGATTPVYEFGPEGTVFAKPVTVTLPFTGTSGTVYWSRLDGSGFDPIGGVIDPVAHTITAETFHFSLGYVGPAVTTRTVSGGASNTFISASLRQNQPLPIADGEVEAIVSDGNGGFTSLPATGGTGTFTIPNVPSNGDYLLHYGLNYLVTSSNTPDLGFLTPGRPNLVPLTQESLVTLNLSGLESWTQSDQLEWFSTEANDWDFNTERLANPFIEDGMTTATLDINVADVDGGPGSEIHSAEGHRAAVGQLTAQETAEHTPYVAMTRVAQFPSTFDVLDGSAQTVSLTMQDVTAGNSLSIDYRGSQFKQVLDTYGNPNSVVCGAGLCGGFAGALAQAYSATDGFYGANADMLLMSDNIGEDLVATNMKYADPTALGGQWGVLFHVRWTKRTIHQLAGTVGRVGVGANGFPDGVDWTTTMDKAQGAVITPKLLPPSNVRINGKSFFAGGEDLGGTATVTWDNPNPPGSLQPAFYSIGVTELTVDGANRTRGIRRAVISTTDTTFTFPPNQILLPGHVYVMSLTAQASTSTDPSAVEALATAPFKSAVDIASATVSSGMLGAAEELPVAQRIKGALQFPSDTVANATQVFWTERGEPGWFTPTNRNAGNIWAANLDGTNAHVIVANQDLPSRIALVDTTLYWINDGDGEDTKIMSLDLTNPLASPQVVADQPHAHGLLAYDGDLYWISWFGTTRFHAGVATSVSSVSGVNFDTDGSNFYYAVYGDGSDDGSIPPATGSVESVPFAGGASTTLASNQPQSWDVHTDGTYVYFSNQAWNDEGNGTINRVPVGGGPVEELVRGNELMKFFTIDATNIYFVVDGFVWSLPKSGGTPTALAALVATIGCPQGTLSIAANTLFFADTCGGASGAGNSVFRLPL